MVAKDNVIDLAGVFSKKEATHQLFISEFNDFLSKFSAPILKISEGTNELYTRDFPIMKRLKEMNTSRASIPGITLIKI